MSRSPFVVCAVAALALAGGGYAAGEAVYSSQAAAYYAGAQAPDLTLVAVRGVGASGYLDDTIAYTTPDGTAQHGSGWETVAVADYGVPADATAVTLSVKGIITKGQVESTAGVYVFARAAGAACCLGSLAHAALPVDGNYGNPVRGLVLQTVAQLARDGQREITQVTVPVTDGAFQWAWGYHREPLGDWPVGDALAVNVYLDGYFR